MKLQKIVNTPIATLTLIGSLIGGANAANLLIDPGFEDASNLQGLGTTVSNFNTNQGKWGVEGGIALSGTLNGVTPYNTMMLSMQSGGSYNQAFQFTNLSAYTSEIASGSATFDMSALFNTGGPHNALGIISAQFYGAGGWNNKIGSQQSNSLTLDGDASTWEQISSSGVIPTGAVWMSTEVAYKGDTMGGMEGFVDEASLAIAVPEPSSTLLLGLGSLGLLLRRSRS